MKVTNASIETKAEGIFLNVEMQIESVQTALGVLSSLNSIPAGSKPAPVPASTPASPKPKPAVAPAAVAPAAVAPAAVAPAAVAPKPTLAKAEADDDDDDDDEAEDNTAAPTPTVQVTEDLVAATKLREVLTILIQRGVNTKGSLTRECLALKEKVPVLQRIEDIAGRVPRAAELLQSGMAD